MDSVKDDRRIKVGVEMASDKRGWKKKTTDPT
jgi:hypothetical protein